MTLDKEELKHRMLAHYERTSRMADSELIESVLSEVTAQFTVDSYEQALMDALISRFMFAKGLDSLHD